MQMKEQYDVIIVGGGTSGIAAAYALKDTNYRILLVEQQQKLGGTATQANVIDWIEGCRPEYLNDIFELLKRNNKLSGDISKSWLPAYFSKLNVSNSLRVSPTDLSDKYYTDLISSIDVLLNFEFIDCNLVANDLNSIKLRNVIDGEISHISGKFFIDCTSSGQLCRAAGINYYCGRDGYEFQKESIASEKNSSILNEPSLIFEVAKSVDDNQLLESINSVYVNDKNILIKPSYIIIDGYFQRKLIDTNDFSIHICNPMTALGISGYDVVNNDYKTIYNEAIKRVYEYWKYLKLYSKLYNINLISNVEGSIHEYGINNIAPMLGIRESYRIECEDILNQNSLSKKIDFDNLGNIIAIGTHPVDMHITTGLNKEELYNFNANLFKPYGVELGCLIPKNIKNTLVCGKSFGATQIALSSARTNTFMAQIGWAAGNCIKYCLKNNLTNVRSVDVEHLRNKEFINFDFYKKNIIDILK